MFDLHEKLKEDCFLLGESDLSLLLLMNDVRYPWFIMVPKRAGIKEIFELTEEEQMTLARESSFLSRTLSEILGGDKINVASLGNVVAQLHIHHIVRFKKDPAWPGPVWGHSRAVPYREEERQCLMDKLRGPLKEMFHLVP